MGRAFLLSIFLWVWGLPAAAQTWIQVEAHPTLRTAEERAREYAQAFEEIVGYRLPGGWYALALGPYVSETQADLLRRELRRGGIIPGDSYLTDGTGYRAQFWPIGAQAGTAPAPVPSTPEVQPTEPVVQSEPEEVFETPRQARASERLLSRDEKRDLQTALQWFGFYTAAIDGSFGRGTRGSMARWQESNGFEATGILTSKQRAALMAAYDAALKALGLEPLIERKAGIEITMPLGLVEFDRYDYPFAQFKSKGDSGVQALLISQAGDEATLAGLYEIMQTLEIVPVEGERRKRNESFTLRGVNETVQSYSFARLGGGYVKGFTLVYPPEKAAEMERVITIMQESFATREGSLEATDSDEEAQSIDLVAGLELRKPKLARSGFYVDAAGSVVTVAEAVNACERITLDEVIEAEVSVAANGLALLTPKERISPVGFARFAPNPGRLRSAVALAGYSYEGALSAPTMTFGTLEDLQGLTGDTRLKRLEIGALPGDVGGPVLDEAGAVSGILTPLETAGRSLPEGTAFAIKSTEIASFLVENGASATPSAQSNAAASEDIARAASEMTVLVSCW
ncbi:MAG: peptidoglycan-binding protein [Litoreibacter sp.]|nr:peptidoglycan-binding protein [Litoreibacter sp.]MCY4335696.1 peptidoglycan-binding protein [Litoreibacter sp.]